ncbi:Os04g0193900 [Oryza sativa Japonica Group]|uniref:Os04g0193900 protein n=1 Tax=Oryza sativa subsp. japonica TaxID=39947 RepID=A0A0P0W7F1_ORYSJ|nr:Os04g0193900 [Oryza sativa Japonica Group]
MGKSPSFGILDDNDCDEVKSSDESTKNLQSDDDDVDDRQYYICPVSGRTFTMKSEVLHYLFSEMDQCFTESKNRAVGSNLTRTHEWLPKGWLVEIRAGGDNMDKMYKFYVYPPNRVRLFSKDDVLLYIKEMKISGFDTDGQCNTSTQENILAILEFNPEGLPQGWVKEVVFRKTHTGRIRRDRHYTDPIKSYVFRTKRSAAFYVETGKVTIRAFVQKTSVHEHESLQKRLNLGRTNQLRTRSSKLQKLSLKEGILSDDQSSSSAARCRQQPEWVWVSFSFRFSVDRFPVSGALSYLGSADVVSTLWRGGSTAGDGLLVVFCAVVAWRELLWWRYWWWRVWVELATQS